MGNSQLRLVSYNLKGLQMDESALVHNLRELEPDVVAVQEPPRFLNARARLRALAQQCGLEVVVYGNYPLGGATTALLATPEIVRRVRASGSKILPFDPWRWTNHWKQHQTWPSRRGFSYMDFGEYVVYSIHLGLNPMERITHRNIILNHIKSLGPHRCVVAGDLNEKPGGDSWQAFERPLADAVMRLGENPHDPKFATFPTRKPTSRIDTVFVGLSINVEDISVSHARSAKLASDHLPIIATLS